MFGQFVEILDKNQPAIPFKIWVEYEWLDYNFPDLKLKAMQILKSGWLHAMKPKIGGLNGTSKSTV